MHSKQRTRVTDLQDRRPIDNVVSPKLIATRDVEGRFILETISRPSFSPGFSRKVFIRQEVMYADDPVFDVLRQVTDDRCLWPLPDITADGHRLAMAFLAAPVSCDSSEASSLTEAA